MRRENFVFLILFVPSLALSQFSLPDGNIAAYPLEKLSGSARCVGMGGACAAIGGALDTATYNPANLNNMDEWEFSAQLRYSEVDGLFFDQDALDSELYGPAPGQFFKIFKDSTVEPAYLGFGKSFGAWSVATHYQQQLEFSGVFNKEEVFDIPNNQIFANFNRLATSIESVGVTASYAISEQWSAGLTISNSKMDVDSVDTWELRSFTGSHVPSTGFNSVDIGNVINDDDTQTTFSFGLRYQHNPKLSFGLAYHEGGEFDMTAVPSIQMTLSGASTGESGSVQTSIGLPDILILGAVWRPSESMLLALSLDSISYSNLPPIRTHTLGYGSEVEGYIEAIDDTVSFRLGFEKTFMTTRNDVFLSNYTIRAGVFTEDDHDGLTTVDGYDTHATIGFGVKLGRSRKLQLDLGLEFGDEDKHYLISLSF